MVGAAYFYISGSGQILAPASTPTSTSTPAPAPTSTPVSTLKYVMFTLKKLPLNELFNSVTF